MAVLAAGMDAAAQQPPSVEPGQIERRFEQRPRPKSLPGAFIPAPEQAPAPAAAASVRFVLVGVALSGNSMFSREELRPLYEDLLDREVSLAEIYGVRDALTAKFRNAGYVLTQAVIPEQTIDAGVVRIEIVEGAINTVRVHGDAGKRSSLIAAYAEKIRAQRPLTAARLERYVLLMDDLPGLSVRAVLGASAGAAVGSDLDLFVEQEAYAASLGFDNRGTAEIGPGQFNGSLAANNLYGRHDSTELRGAMTAETEELRYLELTHALPVSSEGTLVTLGASYSWSQPGAELEPLDIRGTGQSVRLGLRQPIWRGRSRSLELQAELRARSSHLEALGERLSTDRLRSASLGLSYDVADRWQGRNVVAATVAQGLDVLDATETGSSGLSRAGGRSDFTRVTASLRREQPLADRLDLVASLEGQWTGDELLSSEEIAVGGAPYGRGFDASYITGDRGVVGAAELTYRTTFARRWVRDVELSALVDGGAVRNYEDGPTAGEQSLISGGVAVAFQSFGVAFVLELDKPLRQDSAAEDDYDWRGFLSLKAGFGS